MINKIKEIWRDNEDFIIVSMFVFNLIIFAIRFIITYLNYPNKNTLFNILLGTSMISIGQTLLIDIFIFLFFIVIIYMPYIFYIFIKKGKLLNVINKSKNKEDNNK